VAGCGPAGSGYGRSSHRGDLGKCYRSRELRYGRELANPAQPVKQVRRGLRSYHAAQQLSLATSRVNVWAASFMPSDIVRYAWKVSLRSAIVRRNLMA